MNHHLYGSKSEDDDRRRSRTVKALSHDEPKRNRRENDRQHETGERRRRYYRITREGNAVLQTELLRMELMVRKSKSMRLRGAEATL